jgi:beta-fructofuranosidase
MERNISLDRTWSGDFGCNWECGTFIPLQDQATGIERMIGLVGVEGGHLRPHAQAYRAANPGRPERGQRYCNWFFADLTNEGDIGFETTGMMDWGDWYAPSVFLHPDGRRIAWGWIVEEDLSEALAKEKGWIGCLGIPRELGLGVYQGVTGTSLTALAEITSLDVEGTKVVTLDIRPMRGLEQLRRGLLFDKKPVESGVLVSQAPDSYEILLTADIGTKGSLSLGIQESSDVKTTISFINQDEQLVVHRDKSSTNDGICLLDEIAKLSLFSYQSHTEPLELRVFVDKDVVEVFANGRVAISTRIYAPANASGISLAFDSTTHVTGISAWDLGDIGLQGRS